MFTQKDLVQCQNLLRLLNKMKVELDAQEIMAAADVIKWTTIVLQKIEQDLKPKEAVLPEIAPQIESKPKKTSKKAQQS